MTITVFQSDKGDCLLVTGKDGRRVLVDGGMAPAYAEHVAPAMAKIVENEETLDLVYVSHIDDDHIAGVARMFDDMAAWRVFKHHKDKGHPNPKEPKAPRPPEPKAVWHNAFRDTVKDNKGEIADMLAATATILSGATETMTSPDGTPLRQIADEHRSLALGEKSALRLSARLRPEQLNIPLNPQFKGKLMYLRAKKMPPPVKLGGMKLTVLGPREADLKKLRDEWDKWLDKNKQTAKDLQRKAKEFEDELTSSGVENVTGPMLAQAAELGKRGEVTAPNLASLMLLVEENGSTLLLTGDGHWQDILNGLRDQKKLADGAGQAVHVDVLKVQHHGAGANWHDDFARAVIADHYVFCGNGSDENPEPAVIESLVKSRTGKPAERSPHPKAGDKFKLWFNCDKSIDTGSAKPEHFEKVQSLVKKLQAKSGGKMTSFFLTKSSFDVKV